MVHNNIKVGILEKKTNKNSDYNIQRGLMVDIWLKIKVILTKKYKYKIDEKYLKLSHNDLIDEIPKENYDIIIGDFWINQDRLSKVDFTIPILFQRPVILYRPDSGETFTLKYAKYLYKLWRTPLLIIICATITIGFFLYLSVGKLRGFLYSTYFTAAGFFGQSNGILDGWCSNPVTGCLPSKNKITLLAPIMAFAVIYFITIYINATTVARSVTFFNSNNLLESTIENQNIIGNPNSLSSSLIKENGGIVVVNDSKKLNDFQYFSKYSEQKKIAGILYATNDKVSERAKEFNLKVSNINLGSFRVAFPVSKKKTKLQKQLNEIIQKLDDTHEIYKVCSIWGENKYLMC